MLEYEEILTRIYHAEVAELVTSSLSLLPNTKQIEIHFDLRLIVHDADDDKFVNCAFASNAHFIVSDDRHFNILKNIDFPKIGVLQYDEFRKML